MRHISNSVLNEKERNFFVFKRIQSLYKKPTEEQIHHSTTDRGGKDEVCSLIPDSFLPPHFGLLDRPEVWVVDHAVLIDLYGGNDPTGRQHGVLLFSSRIILDNKMVADGK